MKFVLVLSILLAFKWGISYGVELKERPIIGILTQEITKTLNNSFPGHKQFIAASYVKFVEGGGARVVPVWINQTTDYYRNIMSKINGILLPGGSSGFTAKYGYADVGYKIYKIAKEMNEGGNYFPIWGTCLGFELLTYVDADRKAHRVRCESESQSLPLEFLKDFKTGRLYQLASDDIIQILQNEPVTSNFHGYCLTEESLRKVNISQNWRTLSTNRDWNNFEFISSFEHTRYPFYGVQFHPEKNMYEWSLNKNITHTESATRANQYFARFFVEEARKSSNGFEDITTEYGHLIFNFPKTFTAAKSIYSECYLFKPEDDYPVIESVSSNTSTDMDIDTDK